LVKVKWSKQAVEDIFEIRKFYSETSTTFAEEQVDLIFSKEILLAQFPEIGRIVPELNNRFVRELIFRNYRIIFVIFDEANISVLAVHTSSRPLSDISLFEG
jgi:toxin ParE1/3/4